MPRQRRGQLVVGLDQRREGIFVRGGVRRMDVRLDGSRGGATPIAELLHELVVQHLRCGRRLDELGQELGGGFCFGDARG